MILLLIVQIGIICSKPLSFVKKTKQMLTEWPKAKKEKF